jgi:hypothetical protein
MNFEFIEYGWEDFQYWIETDASIVEKSKTCLMRLGKIHFRELVSLSHCDTI